MFYVGLAIVTILTIVVGLLAPIPYNFFLFMVFGPIAGYFWVSISRIRKNTSSQENTKQDIAQDVIKPANETFFQKKTKTRLIYASAIATFTFFVVFFMLTILKNISEKSIRSILGMQTQTASEIQKMKGEIKALQATTESQSLELLQIEQLRRKLIQLQMDIQNKDSAATLSEQEMLLLFPQLSATFSSTPTNSQSTTQVSGGFIIINSPQWQYVDVLQNKIPSSKVIGQAIYGKIYEFLKKEQGYYYIILSPAVNGWINQQFVKEVSDDVLQNP